MRMTLDEILHDEALLGDVKPSSATAGTEEQRILHDFEKINEFMDRHNRKPGEGDTPSVTERSLQIKLRGLLKDSATHAMLSAHDRHELFAKR